MPSCVIIHPYIEFGSSVSPPQTKKQTSSVQYDFCVPPKGMWPRKRFLQNCFLGCFFPHEPVLF